MNAIETGDHRLEDDEIAALDYVFGGMEGAVGVRSTHAQQADRLAGLDDDVPYWEPHEPVEYWACWSTGSQRRAGAVAYRALQAMLGTDSGRLHVSVLYRAYGPRPPGPRLDKAIAPTELARVVIFTETAARVARAARSQSIPCAVRDAVLGDLPSGAAGQLAERVRAVLVARLRAEADTLLTGAVVAYRRAVAVLGGPNGS
jgi:hypothetical protein